MTATAERKAIQSGEPVFIYVDDAPIGMGSAKADGSIEFPRGFVPKDGMRIVFLQADEDAWDEFYRQWDDDAWDCHVCGGSRVREYMDAPEEWGGDCPSEENHLIECRECGFIEVERLRAMAGFLWKRHIAQAPSPRPQASAREVPA